MRKNQPFQVGNGPQTETLAAYSRGEASEEQSLEEMARSANPEEISTDEDDEDEEENVEGMNYFVVILFHFQKISIFNRFVVNRKYILRVFVLFSEVQLEQQSVPSKVVN